MYSVEYLEVICDRKATIFITHVTVARPAVMYGLVMMSVPLLIMKTEEELKIPKSSVFPKPDWTG